MSQIMSVGTVPDGSDSEGDGSDTGEVKPTDPDEGEGSDTTEETKPLG